MEALPLNALRAFSVVYETGGIRPAARTLQVAHSSVSRHLRELEAWIGVPLIQSREGKRSLAFTPQGEALGRASLASLRELEGAVAGIRESRRGNGVTISTSPSFAARWLLPRLHQLGESYPWIELSVTVDQKLVAPSDQGADIFIRMGRGPWDGFACEPLMDDLLFPVMSKSFWREAGEPTEIAKLKDLPLLHDRDPFASWEAWRDTFERNYRLARFDIRSGPRFTSSDLVLRAAAQGLGVALARGKLAQDDLAVGTLVKPFGEPHVLLPDAYWLVRSEDHPERVAVSRVLEWLRDQAKMDISPGAPLSEAKAGHLPIV